MSGQDSSLATVNSDEIQKVVKRRYGKAAVSGGGQGCCCCATDDTISLSYATQHGLYAEEELSLIPEIARNLSRGCGNPTGFATLRPGEVVVDFGCGAGIDVILAAFKVGVSGRVVGVDFVPEMIERAQQAVSETDLGDTIEFVVADLERLTLPDSFADAVVSNCVINLSPDKQAVYREAFRILKPGGRLAISDVVLSEKIEPHLRVRLQSTWSGCLGGAIDEESYFDTISKAGFGQIETVARHTLPVQELNEMACCPGPQFTPAPAKEDLVAVQGKVLSIKFTAVRPKNS